MILVWVRVDDRLIHGQVAVGWTRAVGATRIVVADDDAAGNTMQQTLLKMAAPSGVEVSVLSVADAAQALLTDRFARDKVMLIVRGPEPLLQIVAAGVPIERVNVGNVGMAEGSKRVSREMAANETELAAWKELDRRGIVLEGRWLPGSGPTNVNKALQAFKS